MFEEFSGLKFESAFNRWNGCKLIDDRIRWRTPDQRRTE